MSVSVGTRLSRRESWSQIVVVRGDPIVWFMRLHTCAIGAACQRQCVLGAIAKALAYVPFTHCGNCDGKNDEEAATVVETGMLKTLV